MSERNFWLLVRRALLMVAAAIDQRYGKEVEKGNDLHSVLGG